jgi:hypothetical protein
MLLDLAITAALIASSPIVTPAATGPWQPVQKLVAQLNREASVRNRVRVEEAERLARLVKERAQLKVPERLLSEITSLMSDRVDAVRYWTATALGFLGAQATPSIPALERALDEVRDVHADKTSADAIRLALTRIRSAQGSGK